MSYTKWPETKRDYIDLIIDIAFWVFVLYVWFFGVKALCDPNVVCAPLIDFLTQSAPEGLNYTFNMTSYIG